jgi:hypothetical protein
VAAKLDWVSWSVTDFANLMAESDRKDWALVLLEIGVDTTTPNGKFVANVMPRSPSGARANRSAHGGRYAAKRAEGIHCGRPPKGLTQTVSQESTGEATRWCPLQTVAGFSDVPTNDVNREEQECRRGRACTFTM